MVGRGVIALECKTNNGLTKVLLQDALHVPNASNNLISMGRLTKAGFKGLFGGDQIIIQDRKGDEVAITKEIGNLFVLQGGPISRETVLASQSMRTFDDWH